MSVQANRDHNCKSTNSHISRCLQYLSWPSHIPVKLLNYSQTATFPSQITSCEMSCLAYLSFYTSKTRQSLQNKSQNYIKSGLLDVWMIQRTDMDSLKTYCQGKYLVGLSVKYLLILLTFNSLSLTVLNSKTCALMFECVTLPNQCYLTEQRKCNSCHYFLTPCFFSPTCCYL